MYILEVNESIQPLLLFIGKVLEIIHIVIPIILIVFITIDLSKAVISSDEEKILLVTKSIKNRVIACLAIFFLPTIVETLFTNVFVSLNIDEDYYKTILSSYNSVIYSDKINTQDQTKDTEISSNMTYSITNTNSSSKYDNESEFLSISKTLIPYIFTKDRFDTLIKSVTTEDFIVDYSDKTYPLNDKISIKCEGIILNGVLDNGEYIIASLTLQNAIIDETYSFSEVLVDYYYINISGNCKLKKVSVKPKKTLSNYNENIVNNEKTNEIVSVDKYVSNDSDYDYNKLNNLSSQKIKSIYSSNLKNIVMLRSVSYSAVVNRAVGFFISDGVVATSWSYLQNSFMSSQTITISDIYKNVYKCNGVIALDIDNDIAVIKLDRNVKVKVNLKSSDHLLKNDPVITITSKTGTGLTTITGIISSNKDNIMNILPLSKNDWGSPVFDKDGNVVGINTIKLINSEISSASKVEGLISLQEQLKSTKFDDIKTTSIEELKKQYYYRDSNKEKVNSSVPNNIWNEYKKIGKIEENIVLNLLKASYHEGILSLRYENTTSQYISNISYSDLFISELKQQGYKQTSSSNEKIIYEKRNNKVIIMSEFDYLIIVLVKGSIL